MDQKRVDFLFDFISESDAIEEIYNDPDVLRKQIESGKNTGHVGAMLFLEALSESPINQYLDNDFARCHPNLLCHTQGLIVKEQHLLGAQKLSEEEVGRWRKCGVSVDGQICPPWKEVPSLMEDFFQITTWFQNNSRFQGTEGGVKMIADIHFKFLKIHPFTDGNGRTARAISCFLFRHCALTPFIFTEYDKHEKYYPCFGEPDSLRMREYFFEKFKG